MIGLARSYVATNELELAKIVYHKISNINTTQQHITAQMEAQIFQGNLNNSLLQNREGLNSEQYFFLAVSHYMKGHLIDCQHFMGEVTQADNIWKEEDPKDKDLSACSGMGRPGVCRHEKALPPGIEYRVSG